MSIFSAIAAAAALALFCLAQGIFWIVRGARREREAALMRRLQVTQDEEQIRITRDLQTELTGVLAGMDSMQRFNRTLMQAGINTPLRSFLLLTLALVVGVFLLVLLATGSFGGSLMLGLITGAGLYTYVMVRRENRMAAIEVQLPKALELMMIGLRAGHTLEDTIRYAGEELQPPLSLELTRCYEEYDMGRPIEQAMSNMADRLSGCKALRTFVESVLVLKQSGGNLIEIIEQIIESLRAQSAFEARYRALTSEGRTSGMILGGLPVLVLSVVLLVQPGYVGLLLKTSGGQTVLALSASFWFIGIIWLVKLVKPTS